MDFEAYLTSKRIDSARFHSAEPEMWRAWKTEFEQVHPNSFTVQKLNLINPVRRKYQLKVVEPAKPAAPAAGKGTESPPAAVASSPKPAMPRPAMKVMPKMPAPKPVVPPRTTQSASEPSTEGLGKAATSAEESTHVPETTNATEAATAASSPPVEDVKHPPAAPPESDTPEAAKGNVAPGSSPGQPASNTSPQGTTKPPRPVIPRPVIKPPKPKTN